MDGRSIGPTVETTGWVSRSMTRPMTRVDDDVVVSASGFLESHGV
jgi:hypothetical protein